MKNKYSNKYLNILYACSGIKIYFLYNVMSEKSLKCLQINLDLPLFSLQFLQLSHITPQTNTF